MATLMIVVVVVVLLVVLVLVIMKMLMVTGLTPEQRWERHITCFFSAAKSPDNEKLSSGWQPSWWWWPWWWQPSWWWPWWWQPSWWWWQKLFSAVVRWGECWREQSKPAPADQVTLLDILINLIHFHHFGDGCILWVSGVGMVMWFD